MEFFSISFFLNPQIIGIFFLFYLLVKVTSYSQAVAVHLDAGNPENSMFMYFSKYPNIFVTCLDGKMIDPNWKQNYLVSQVPIYFVTRNAQLAGLDKFLIEKKEFIKPDSMSSVVVYEV